jgi:hypothetical protein
MSNLEQNGYEYLTEDARKVLHSGNPERVQYIRSSRWIGYSRAKEIISNLDDLLVYPQKHRMPNLLIIGESNTGKSMIADRFCELNQPYEREDGEGIVIPVLSIISPPVPNESRLYGKILDRLLAPYSHSDSAERKQSQVLKLMRRCNVKMLMIDEIHSMLAGNMEKQRIFLSVIRNLGNELRIPIVGLGTKDALRAIKTDPQLDNRFKSVFLPRWEYSPDFRRLLASFECMLPLKDISNLKSEAVAKKLLSMSEGLLGELSEIISEAAVIAVHTGREKIDLDVLSEMDWQSPTQRKRANG